jgi:hypothetical protein
MVMKGNIFGNTGVGFTVSEEFLANISESHVFNAQIGILVLSGNMGADQQSKLPPGGGVTVTVFKTGAQSQLPANIDGAGLTSELKTRGA